MLEKIGRAAEKAAASVPRRQFLGRLGRGAAILAGTLGGILLTAGPAEARGGGWCCLQFYGCTKGKCGKGNPGFSTVRCRDYPGFCP